MAAIKNTGLTFKSPHLVGLKIYLIHQNLLI